MVRTLDGWWAKGIGVIGMTELPRATGIVLPGVASVHTLFVKFPLDILFLDKSFKLMKAQCAVSPWKPLVCCPGAHYTVELASHTLSARLINSGDEWRIVPE
jgi:uncharacterized membrane protein (UPF0127 family)